ncbi:hypothetical protein LIER_31309 [Lithospermum erythrorhizon]|uniref:Uncharacterized protein n=1 Tax=Lithospermum erythrorhizon TaxID=34254 RepID=A0AAV3RUK2_LITER
MRISTKEGMEKYRLKLVRSSSKNATGKDSRMMVGVSPGFSEFSPAWELPAIERLWEYFEGREGVYDRDEEVEDEGVEDEDTNLRENGNMESSGQMKIKYT